MAMGTLSPHLPTKIPEIHSGGGGRPPLDRGRGGGGGGGRGGDNVPDYGERMRRYRLGVAVGLVSVVAAFVSFSVLYIARQSAGKYDVTSGRIIRDWQPVNLPTTLLWVNTLVLIASSVTLEVARRQANKHATLDPVYLIPGIRPDRERTAMWVATTALLGVAFLFGQWRAWLLMEQRGWFVNSGASSSFFYILTGAHAVHLMGGLLGLFYVLASAWQRKPAAQRCVVIDVISWYWHVIALLWMYLFALLAYARG